MTAVPSADYGVRPTVADAQRKADPAGRLSDPLLGVFSGPAFPLAALALPLVVYLPHFYAAHLGLSLTAVGAVFSIIRLIDIGFDPVLGGLMDRTRSPIGRFKPWMLASIPILMIAAYLCFMPPAGAKAPT